MKTLVTFDTQGCSGGDVIKVYLVMVNPMGCVKTQQPERNLQIHLRNKY